MNGKAGQPGLTYKFVSEYHALHNEVLELRAQCAVLCDSTFQSGYSTDAQDAADTNLKLEKLLEERDQWLFTAEQLQAELAKLSEQAKILQAERDRALQQQAVNSNAQQQVTELQTQLASLQQELVALRNSQASTARDGETTQQWKTKLDEANDANSALRKEIALLKTAAAKATPAAAAAAAELTTEHLRAQLEDLKQQNDKNMLRIGQLQEQTEHLDQQNKKLYGDKRRLEKVVTELRGRA